MKKRFFLYCDTYEPIKSLPEKDKADLLDCLFLYNREEPLVSLSPLAKLAFEFIKQGLDRDGEQYEKMCKKNQSNGKFGGRPKKPKKPTGLSGLNKKPKKPDTDTDTDTDTDKIIKRENKYSLPQSITDNDFQEISEKYQVPLAFVRSKFDDVCNWEGEKPGRMRGRNWRMTLMNWVKRDSLQIKQDYAKRSSDVSI